MGTDLIAIAQVMVDGKWILNPLPVFPTYCYHRKFYDEKEAEESNEFSKHPVDHRFRDWWAVIANFANERFGHRDSRKESSQLFSYIANPRGIPPYFSTNDADSKAINDCRISSWLHIQDFDEFDWNTFFLRKGNVALEEYKKIRGTVEIPRFYHDFVGGSNVVILSQGDADEYLDGHINLPPDKRMFIEHVWPMSYSEWFKPAIACWVDPLRELTGIFQDARIVFGFQ